MPNRVSKPDFIVSLRLATREVFQSKVLELLRRQYENIQEVAMAQGDGGIDMVLYNQNRVYACYAPDSPAAWKRIGRKLNSDFSKVQERLGDSLKEWVFIHNHPTGSLPPDVASVVLKLRLAHPEVRLLEVWGIDHLWEAVFGQAKTAGPGQRGIGSFRRASKLSIRELFVEPEVQLMSPLYGDEQFAIQHAHQAFDHWVAWSFELEPNQRNPLVLIGPFGSGKSMLLGSVFDRLAEDRISPEPVAVPLRDLVSAPTAETLGESLLTFMFSGRGMEEDRRYCILCDGFDELNLHFHDHPGWVLKAFRSLRALMVSHPNVIVAISSRPILLWDPMHSRAGLGPVMDLHLQPFDEARITQWCLNRRKLPGHENNGIDLRFLREKHLLEVARNPLVLFMIAEMATQLPDYFSSERRYRLAEVYRQFMDWTVAHGAFHADDKKHVLPENYREVLGEIAWFAFEQNSELMREKDLLSHLVDRFGKEIETIPVDRNLLIAHMIQPVTAPAVRESEKASSLVEFTHQSFREYFTAERIWQLVQEIGNGQSGTERWRQLARRMPGRSELGFIRDFCALLPADECEKVYHGCYDQLKPLAYVGQKVMGGVGTVGTAALMRDACAASSLAFFVCFNLLRRIENGRLGDRVLRTADLDEILRWRRALPESFLTELSYFESNLRELELHTGHLVHHDLMDVDFTEAVLHELRLHQCTLNGACLRDATLEKTAIEHSIFWFRDIEGASFRDGSFSDSTWEFNDSIELRGGDFTGVRFSSSRLLDPRIEGATFIRNSWTNAQVLRGGANHDWQLKNCRLDLAATQFFAEHHVPMIDCDLDPALPEGYSSIMRDSLEDIELPRAKLAICLLVNEDVSGDLPAELLAHLPFMEQSTTIGWLTDGLILRLLRRKSPTLVIFPAHLPGLSHRVRRRFIASHPPAMKRIALRVPSPILSPTLETDQIIIFDFANPRGRPWWELETAVSEWMLSLY